MSPGAAASGPFGVDVADTEKVDPQDPKERSAREPHRVCPACLQSNVEGVRFCTRCGATLPEPGADEGLDSHYIGKTIENRYLVEEVIGRGGMGCVYRVEQVHLKKPLALKMLHENLLSRRSQVSRFLREARAISRLESPHTVRLYDFGRYGEIFYLVMELLEGRELDLILDEEGPLPTERAVRLLVQVCDSLAEAHAAGVVHRDLKPENIMVVPGPEGEVAKVLDFGLAKVHDAEDLQTIQSGKGMFGTPYYMAPEQIRALKVDARTDLYALGAMAFRLLTGSYAYEADTTFDILKRHLSDPVPSMRVRAPERPLSRALDRVVMRCLAKDPADRFSTAREVKEALLAALEQDAEPPGEPDRDAERPQRELLGPITHVASFERRLERRRIAYAAAISVVIVGVIVVAWALVRSVGAARSDGVEHEPNNTVESADRLSSGLPIRGTLGQRLSPTAGDRDVFAVLAQEDGHLAVTVTGIPGVDLALDIMDAQGRVLQTFDRSGTGDGEQLHHLPVSAGSAFLAVREALRPGALPRESLSDTYEIVASVSAPTGPTELETNDTPALATPVVEGVRFSAWMDGRADMDVFRLDGAPSGSTRFTVEVSATSGLRLRVALDNGREEPLFAATTLGGAPDESLEFVVSPDSTPVRYLSVSLAPGPAATGAYGITVRMRPEDVASESEPNDDVDGATPLLVGQQVRGALGRGDSDVFRVRIPGAAPRALRVVVEHEGRTAPVVWRRDGDQWVQLPSSLPLRSSLVAFELDATGPDTLVRLTPPGSQRLDGPYLLRVDAAPDTVAKAP